MINNTLNMEVKVISGMPLAVFEESDDFTRKAENGKYIYRSAWADNDMERIQDYLNYAKTASAMPESGKIEVSAQWTTLDHTHSVCERYEYQDGKTVSYDVDTRDTTPPHINENEGEGCRTPDSVRTSPVEKREREIINSLKNPFTGNSGNCFLMALSLKQRIC